MDEHAGILRKLNRDFSTARPDITHQSLLMLLDSPLNRAGLLQVFIRTGKFNQEPNYFKFKKFEFSRLKKVCIFCHLNREYATKGLTVLEFFSEMPFYNEKLIPKRISGKFELFEILV